MRKPDPAERRLQDALAAFTSALDETRVPWMVIGGIAVIARGVRRMTTDIDAVLQGDRANTAGLLRILARKQIIPRIEDVEAFAQQSLVLLLRHEPTGVDLDVSFGWTAFEHEALEARSAARYGSVVAPMARAEDLVIFKTLAARPKDIEDAAALLLMHKNIDLDRVRRRPAELAELADEPAVVSGFEAAIARSASARTHPKPAPAKRPAQTRTPAKSPLARKRKTATAKTKPRIDPTPRKRRSRS